MPSRNDKVASYLAGIDGAQNDKEVVDRYHAAFAALGGDAQALEVFMNEMITSGRMDRVHAARDRYVDSLAEAIAKDHERRREDAFAVVLEGLTDEEFRRKLAEPPGDEPLDAIERDFAQDRAELLRQLVRGFVAYLVATDADQEELTAEKVTVGMKRWLEEDPEARALAERAAVLQRFSDAPSSEELP